MIGRNLPPAVWLLIEIEHRGKNERVERHETKRVIPDFKAFGQSVTSQVRSKGQISAKLEYFCSGHHGSESFADRDTEQRSKDSSSIEDSNDTHHDHFRLPTEVRSGQKQCDHINA